MKRSEIVKYIVSHLKVMDDYARFEDKELNERADLILSGLELRGMMPPAHDAFKNRKNMYMDVFMVNKWEDEDET